MTGTPLFNFIPLNGPAFANTINTEIPTSLLFDYYKQGYHADTLIRTMVASVSIKDAKGNVQILVNEPLNPSYKDFLIFCKKLSEAQLLHKVSVVACDPPLPADNSADKTSQQPLTVYDVKLSDVVAAKAAGFSVTNATAKDPANSTPASTNSAGMAYDVKPTINKINMLALTPGLSKDDPKLSEYIKDTFKDPNAVQYQMRTFEAAMYSTAKEAVSFKLLSDGPDDFEI